jgi:adenosine kinase
MAFDTIMVFEDKFKNHILPEQTHMINVSFLAPKMQRFQGGCAGNIAYNLKMLGGDPRIMAAVGVDFGAYADWLDAEGISREYITTIDEQFTAQAFVTTDMDNNQITAFHPGAMNFAHVNQVNDAVGVELAMVSPDGRDAMLQHALQLSESSIPFFFDPGQALPLFNGEEFLTFFDQATFAIANDYEAQLIADRTGLSIEELAAKVDAFIVTKGGEGSVIYAGSETIEIPTAPIGQIQDPTGCGDAYRAGILFGLSHKLDWESCGKIGALCGAIKVEHAGTQSHRFDIEQFSSRYVQAFEEPFPIPVA